MRSVNKTIKPITNKEVVFADLVNKIYTIPLASKCTPSMQGQNDISLICIVDLKTAGRQYVVNKNNITVFSNGNLHKALDYYNNDYNF